MRTPLKPWLGGPTLVLAALCNCWSNVSAQQFSINFSSVQATKYHVAIVTTDLDTHQDYSEGIDTQFWIQWDTVGSLSDSGSHLSFGAPSEFAVSFVIDSQLHVLKDFKVTGRPFNQSPYISSSVEVTGSIPYSDRNGRLEVVDTALELDYLYYYQYLEYVSHYAKHAFGSFGGKTKVKLKLSALPVSLVHGRQESADRFCLQLIGGQLYLLHSAAPQPRALRIYNLLGEQLFETIVESGSPKTRLPQLASEYVLTLGQRSQVVRALR